MSGLDDGASTAPATLHMRSDEEPEVVSDKRFLFSDGGASRPVWLVHGRQVPKLPVLAALCAALALVCLLLGGYCAALRGRGGPPSPAADCRTTGCLRQAAEILTYQNSSADPCQDFYEFACGRFDDAHPLGIEISYGIVDVLENLNEIRVEDLLRRTQFHNDSSAISKAKTFYSTCESSFRGNSNSDRLREVINGAGGLDLFGTFDPENWSFDDVFLKTREINRLRLFFSITWLQTLNRIVISLPRLGLKHGNMYTDDSPQARSKLDDYRQSIVAALKLVQSDLPDEQALNRTCADKCAEEVADDVIHIETEIAKAMPKNNVVVPAASNLMSLQDLNSLASRFKWRRLLDTLFGAGVIADSSTVQVPSKEYMTNLNALIKASNATQLNNYIQWNLVRQYMPAMGPRFAIMAQEMDVIGGAKTKPRKEVCFDLLRHYFPRALRALFILGHIGEDNVAAATRLVKRVKRLLSNSFGWMTPEARATSLSVLDDLQVEYGHSPWVTDPRRLNEYYGELTLTKRDFFTNMLNADRFKASELKANAARLGNDDADDDDVWVEGETADVKVVYNPVRGRLRVPVGGLQVPLFSHDNPDYVNAATFGSIVLAELAGPFFLRHRTYRLPSWWDDETKSTYRRYSMCLMDSLDGYTIRVTRAFGYSSRGQSGAHARSEVPLDPHKSATYVQAEHLAFTLAYDLYKQIVAEDGPQQTLPGTQGQTPEQIFFLAYAQSRCRHTNQYLKVLLNSAFKKFPHSEMINNFVFNSPSFMKAYGCSSIPAKHQGRQCVLQ